MGLSEVFLNSFGLATALCIGLQVYMRYASTSTTTSSNTVAVHGENAAQMGKFRSFQINYLVVFLLAMFADWLQGPYVYELYVSYGFNQVEIAQLFVMGFGSSMIFGTFIGSLADSIGRKTMCILYCICYIVACLTKLVPNFWILMVGRFLSGIATSLLFSVFESWMVCEHFRQGFDSHLLSETFAYATFGNGLVAVFAGLVANTVAASSFGYVAPFLVAILPLIGIMMIVSSSWNENYGNQQLSMLSSLMKGFDLIRRDSRITALGIAQSCFEGSMYTFVFMWTPALKTSGDHLDEAANTAISTHLGLIFAVFMISVMIGSSFFKLFTLKSDQYLYAIPILVHGCAFLAMFCIPIFYDNKPMVYIMFVLFEGTVGLFYPSYGMIKSEKIPEDIRSGVMNIFRIPLNAFVVFLLLKIKTFPPTVVFQICAVTHFIALASYLYFYYSMKNRGIDVSRKNTNDGKSTGGSNYKGETLNSSDMQEIEMLLKESGDQV